MSGAWGQAGKYGDTCEADGELVAARWAGPWDKAQTTGEAKSGRRAVKAPPRTCLRDAPYIPKLGDDKSCEMRVAGHHGCLTWHMLGFAEGYEFPKPQGWP